ncbi:MAG TPA: hypothetical protein VJR92_08910 [Gemmatimonadaceae bacterium]|nr:hypothetical protein [Gemmatimonadaceae bacterium]
MTDPFLVPEMTRGMRSFASPSAIGGTHDRFFAPLVDARRSAQSAGRWQGRLTAFDAERLDAVMRGTLRTFATERFPRSEPDQRGLSAELEDACGEFFAALESLGRCALAVREAPDDDARVQEWEAWLVALRAVFAAADRGWEEAQHFLDPGAAPRERRSRRHRRGRRPAR